METCKRVKSSESRRKHDAKRSHKKKKKKIDVFEIYVTHTTICIQNSKKCSEDEEKLEKEVRVEKSVKNSTSDTRKQGVDKVAEMKMCDESRSTKKDLQSQKNEELKDTTCRNNKLRKMEDLDEINRKQQLSKEGRQLYKMDKNGKVLKLDFQDIKDEMESCGNQDNRLLTTSSEPEKRFSECLPLSRQQSCNEETPLKEICVENGVENECHDMSSYKNFEEKEKDDCDEEKNDCDESEKMQKLTESELQCNHKTEKDDGLMDKSIVLTHPSTDCPDTVEMGGTRLLSLTPSSQERSLLDFVACSVTSNGSLLEDTRMLSKVWKDIYNQRSQTDRQCKSEQEEIDKDAAIKDGHSLDDTSAAPDLSSRRQFVPEMEDKDDNSVMEAESLTDDETHDRLEKTEWTVLQDGDKFENSLDDSEQDKTCLDVVLKMKEMELDTIKVKFSLMNLSQEMEANKMQLQDLWSYVTKETSHRDWMSVRKFKEKNHKFSQVRHVQTSGMKLNETTKIFKYQMPLWVDKSKRDNSSEPQDADSNNNNSSAGSHGKSPSGNSDRGHSSKENSRNQEDEKDIDEQENPPGDKENDKRDNSDQASGEEHDKSTEATSPSANFKYRKKHGMDDSDLTDLLGKLKDSTEAIPPDILEKVDECLVICLTTRKTEAQDSLNECNICVFLVSLLSHFGSCMIEYQSCSLCMKTFILVQHHLQGCIQKAPCSVVVCQKIQEKIKTNPEKFLNNTQDLWRRLKKYLARCANNFESGSRLDDNGVDEFASMGMPSMSSIGSSLQSVMYGSLGSAGSQSVRMPRISTSYYPSLRMIPEDMNQIPLSRSYPSRRKPNSAPVASRNKQTGEVTYHTGQENLPKRLQNPRYSVTSPRPRPRVSFAGIAAEEDIRSEPQSLTSLRLQAEEPIESFREPRSIEPISLNHERTYGVSDLHSMPIGYDRREMFPEQLLSLEDKPTGVPGVGEVVYGTRDQLIKVIRVWSQEKEVILKKGQLLHRHIREEGVILVDYKKQFELFRTRYQKNFQWIRLTHLGTGMSGKCHLAMDYNTDYKFCVKKIYLAKYEEVELHIWSDLNHPSIVQLHGAIRRGAKVYIFAEFIDGGCLTKTINDHKAMNRRLSHRMALLYLKQILQVLVYLEKKSIIHEDIKADNILLRQNSSKIVITDFGVASRVIQNRTQRGTSPIGTPTNFSPEKAESKGHGVKSDVWSAVCVLIHMLSGSPPWVKRFPSVKTLNYIIASKDAPVVDLPKNVSKDVQELVEYGLNKNPDFRPTAAEMLQHRAFRFLDDLGTQDTTSILMSSECQPTSNTLGDEPADEIDDKIPLAEATIDVQGRGIVEKIDHFLSERFDRPVSLLLPPDEDDSEKITVGADSVLPPGAASGEMTQKSAILPAITDGPLKELGVSWPPKAPKYEFEDPMLFIKKYLLDPVDYVLPQRNTTAIINPVYQLQFYEPEPPRTRSPSTESSEDIEQKIQAIINPEKKDTLPDFNALFDGDNKEGESLPEEVQDLHNRALEQGIQKAGGLTPERSDIPNYFRSPSSRQDSDRYDEELRQLQSEVMGDSHIEVLDIMDLTTAIIEPLEILKERSEDESPLTTLRKSSESSESTVKNNLPNILPSLEDESVQTAPEHKDVNSSNSVTRSSSEEVVSSKSSGQNHLSLDSRSETGSQGNQEQDKVLPSIKVNSDMEGATVTSPLPNFEMLTVDDKPQLVNMPADDEYHSEELFGSGLPRSSSPISVSHSQPTSSIRNTSPAQNMLTFEPTSPAIDRSTGVIPETLNRFSNEQRMFSSGMHIAGTSKQLAETCSQVPSYPPEKSSLEQLCMTQLTKRTHSPEMSGIKRAHSPRLNLDKLKKSDQVQKSKLRSQSEPSFSPINTQDRYKFYTPQQEKSNIGFAGGQACHTSGLGTGSSPKSIPLFKCDNGEASSGVFTASPDDKKRSFGSIVHQSDQEIANYMRDLSHHSGASPDISQLEDLEENAEPPVEFYEPSEDSEREDEMSLLYVQEQYVAGSLTDAHSSSGVLVKVQSNSNILFEMKLQGEHANEPWESILEKELSDKIHDHGHTRFTIKMNGEHLDLGVVPQPGDVTLQVVDVKDEHDAPWHCESSLIMK